MLVVDAHPTLDLQAFISQFPRPVGEMTSPRNITELLSLETRTAFDVDANVKLKIRDLLRHGGYKPTGRGKPASEYLRQAVEKGSLSPINLPVDACNGVSLHSGLPISVVDLGLVQPPLRIRIADQDSEYAFNATGQTIKLDGLLCLCDSDGPCANGVKDSQRTKTSATTVRTLSLVWGTSELVDRSEQAAGWYRSLLEAAGATTQTVEIEPIAS